MTELLSTMAIASATIVAVIGGFLLHNGVQLSTEQRRIKSTIRMEQARTKASVEDRELMQEENQAATQRFQEETNALLTLMWKGRISEEEGRAALANLEKEERRRRRVALARAMGKMRRLRSEAYTLEMLDVDFEASEPQADAIYKGLKSLFAVTFTGVIMPLVFLLYEEQALGTIPVVILLLLFAISVVNLLSFVTRVAFGLADVAPEKRAEREATLSRPERLLSKASRWIVREPF